MGDTGDTNIPAASDHIPPDKSDGLCEPSITITVLHNGTKYQLDFKECTTVLDVKKALEPLTHIPVDMQKLIFRGMLSNESTLKDLNLSSRTVKFMLVGTSQTEAEQLKQSEAVNPIGGDTTKTISSDTASNWCDQEEHKRVLERFGKPDNAMIGILNTEDILAPDECLTGLCDKRGQPLRLRIKPDTGSLWLATNDMTHKFPLATIHDVVSQPIKNHPEYHIMAFQLGPTPKSRYFVYWLPSQYVESIKTMVLQHKILSAIGSSSGNGSTGNNDTGGGGSAGSGPS